MHAYSIEHIVEWTLRGVLYLVLSAPVLRYLVEVEHSPPAWWYRWHSYYDWYNGSDNDWHPLPGLGDQILIGCWRLLADFVDESATVITGAAISILTSTLGSLPGRFANFAHWLSWISDRIGFSLPWWASDVAYGLARLFDWLPDAIKFGGWTWSGLLDNVYNRALSWVVSNYETARQRIDSIHSQWQQFGYGAALWVVTHRAWLTDLVSNFQSRVLVIVESSTSWLGELRRDPAAWIASVLGSATMLAIAQLRDSGGWLYAVWSNYRHDLNEFLADPGGWLIRQMVNELERIW